MLTLVRFDYRTEKGLYGELAGGTVREVYSFYDRPLIYTGRFFSPDEVMLRAPFTGRKIAAAGLNYQNHAAELGMEQKKDPVIFLKPASSVIDPGGEIKIPPRSTRVDYEGELALVIARECRNVRAADAAGFILGYTVMNDVTARDLQSLDGQWTRAKGFDSFAPLGPAVVCGIDPLGLGLTVRVNGEVRQSGSTGDLIHGPCELLEFVSSVMTLCEGDIIATGTPPGVGRLLPGDTVAVEIESIGSLVNTVV